MQNDKLKNAILENNVSKVNQLLTDENLVVQGLQADVNYKLEFNSFIMSPLMLAI